MTDRTHQTPSQVLDALYDGSDRRRMPELLADIKAVVSGIDGDWPSWAQSLLDMLEAAENGQAQGAGAPGEVSDPTLGAVIRREDLTRQRADVFGYLDDAVHAIRSVRNLMAKMTRTANAAQLARDIASQRCTGGMGLPGADTWGDPTCAALGDSRRKGLCPHHVYARRRWEADQQAAGHDPAR